MIANIKTAAILMAVLYGGISSVTVAAPATVTDATATTTITKPQVSIETRLTRVETILKARTKAQLDTLQRLDLLSMELMSLQGRIEETTLEQGKMTQRQRDIINDIERMRSLVAIRPAKSNSIVTDAAIINASNQAVNETGKEAYNTAIKLIKHDRNYVQAIIALEKFIVDYPKSELAPNARYWLGLLLRRDNQNEAAKAQFEKIVTDHPESNKRADSLQKLGQIAKVAGLKGDAKRYFDMVITQYPNNAAARLAKKELASLK